MADVSATKASDRAQLILVSGLTLAVTMLILVLLLNTAIYTENVATRGVDSDIGDAALFQQTLDEEIGAIIANEGTGNTSNVSENVTAAIELLFEQQANSSIENGHLAEADITEVRLADPEAAESAIAEVEYELRYMTSDVRYETTRTVVGEAS